MDYDLVRNNQKNAEGATMTVCKRQIFRRKYSVNNRTIVNVVLPITAASRAVLILSILLSASLISVRAFLPSNLGVSHQKSFVQALPRRLSTLVSLRSSAAFSDNTNGEYELKDRIKSIAVQDSELEYLRRQHNGYLSRGKYEDALHCLHDIISVSEKRQFQNGELLNFSEEVDSIFQAFTSRVFAPPFGRNHSSRRRIFLGVKAFQMQLSSTLAYPYNTVPKKTLVDALKALTAINSEKERNDGSGRSDDNFKRASDEAFRVLQRLVTGFGVREQNSSYQINDVASKAFVSGYRKGNPIINGRQPVKEQAEKRKIPTKNGGVIEMEEQEFNRVLNAFANAGRMQMAHRIVALQKRTPHAPPLSPVAYSILLKGYGRLGDLRHVELVLAHAIKDEIEPDTILLNTLLDAYINCNAMDKARNVFEYMKTGAYNATILDENTEESGILLWFKQYVCPRPNRRTYNTMLKGLARSGKLDEALSLSEEMKELRLWDPITTNTVVQAAIRASDVHLAEEILTTYTVTKWDKQKKPYHPNLEAYTELLDMYAKSNKLNKAVSTLQLMRKRGVEPNEVTYTCLLGGLGRRKKLEQAHQTLQFMNSTDVRITSKSYNALISGLVQVNTELCYIDYHDDNCHNDDLNVRVDEAMMILREMIHSGLRPNDITVSVLVDALGRCNPPRMNEATLLVEKLGRQNYVSAGNVKVGTALVQAYGKSGDIIGALKSFQSIQRPDTVAVNAFLDACCRCGRDRTAKETFEHFYYNRDKVSPDVVSYSIIIGSLLRTGKNESTREALRLYQEMKSHRRIRADNALIDIILKALIRRGNDGKVLTKSGAHLLAAVLKDAEYLKWEEGQLARRKRAVRSVYADQLRSDIWKKDGLDSLLPPMENDLFERMGWNKVDSGFRLWGGGRSGADENLSSQNKPVDKFLQSHGWNDVNSGFRLI